MVARDNNYHIPRQERRFSQLLRKCPSTTTVTPRIVTISPFRLLLGSSDQCSGSSTIMISYAVQGS